MKQIKIVRMLMLGCIVMTAVGCATPPQLDPEVARSMVELRRDLSSTRAQLERTTATLTDIAKNPRMNTSQQIGFFDEEMKKLEESIQLVRDIATHMETHTEQYFKAWNEEMGKMQDQQLAAAAEGRSAVSRQAVESVKEKLQALKDEGAPMMSGLRDLQRYFKSDRTADGAHAAVPTIQKTVAMKSRVSSKLDAVIAQIDSVTKTVE